MIACVILLALLCLLVATEPGPGGRESQPPSRAPCIGRDPLFGQTGIPTERPPPMNTPSSASPRRPPPWFRAVTALALSASVLLSGCVSLRSMPVPTPGQSNQTIAIKVGDKVRVVTTSGERLAFGVTAVEPDAFVGRASSHGDIVRVKYQDIGSLQVRKLDKTGTALLVVVVVIAVGAGIAIASGPPMISGPLVL